MTNADMRWESTLFHWEGGVKSWPLRGHWLTQTILHTFGRDVVLLLSFVVLIGVGLSLRNPWLRPYRRGLSYLFTSVLASVLLVRIGKAITHMTCPWDVVEFGGHMLHSSLFATLPEGAAYGQCFPGGHSSGGFAWVALFYFFKEYQPRYAKAGLIFGLALGSVFGFTQELRGAHFLSHDLWSLAVAWICASLLYYGFFLWRPSARSIERFQTSNVIKTAALDKSMTK
nr:phosphatase PAP2 family protein [Shewanella acanthi]